MWCRVSVYSSALLSFDHHSFMSREVFFVDFGDWLSPINLFSVKTL